MVKTLIEKYFQTIKGSHIIACIDTFDKHISNKLHRPVYKNGIVYHKINDKFMSPKEIEIWKKEQLQEHLKYFGLIEDDIHLSEEKLSKIKFEEGIGRIRNIELIGINNTDTEQLKNSILALTHSKIRNI